MIPEIRPYTNNYNEQLIYKGQLESFNIIQQGYLEIDNFLLLAIEDDQNLVSQYIYDQLQNYEIKPFKVPTIAYAENNRYNFFPDIPIAKQITIQPIYNQYSKLLTANLIKSLVRQPIIAKVGHTLFITLRDSQIEYHLQKNQVKVDHKLQRLIQKAEREDVIIYYKISNSDVQNYFIFDPLECQVTVDDYVSSLLPPFKTINDRLLDAIYSTDPYNAIRDLIKQQLILGSTSILMDTYKNLGKRKLFKKLADAYGFVYWEKDINTVSSIKHITQFLEKATKSHSFIYLRNIEFIEQILLYNDHNITKADVCQQIDQLRKKLTKTNFNTVFVICLQKISGLEYLKSSFDHYVKFKPENNQEICNILGIDHIDTIKGIQWRLVEKDRKTSKNEIEFLKSLEKRQKTQQISVKTKIEDVGGMEEAMNEIAKTILLPQYYPEIFDELVRPRRGILFYGPPGTGKTLLAKCIATELKMNFISVKGPEMLNQYVGQSEQNIRDLFSKAKDNKPSLVFFDELDALAPARGTQGDSNQVMDRIVAQFLTEVDCLTEGVFIIGATNRPDLLDPALLRPGRFDKTLYLGIKADRESRVKMLRALIKTDQFDDIVDKLPPNITGADMQGLTSQAYLYAAKRLKPGEKLQLTFDDLLESLQQLKPSVSESDLRHYESLRSQFSK